MKKTKKTVTSRPAPLFLLSLFDRIYYCIFNFVMKTPRLDEPHVMAVIIIAHMIGINTIVLLLFIKSQTGIQIARGNAIIGILLLYVLLFSLTAYYYDWKKNGERIVKYYKGKMDASVSVVIGYIIFLKAYFYHLLLVLSFFTENDDDSSGKMRDSVLQYGAIIWSDQPGSLKKYVLR
jgi:hypothetical protein